jgi:hypothetical protein
MRSAFRRRSVQVIIGIGLVAGCFYLSKYIEVERLARAETVVTPFTLQKESYTDTLNGYGHVMGIETASRSSGFPWETMSTLSGGRRDSVARACNIGSK